MMPAPWAAANVEELRVTEFSDLLRDRASAIWELEHQHPFVVELGNGTLPLEKFQWYMKQDYLFLIDFSRVIAMAVAKADTLEDMGWFARLLDETLNTEMALHVSFCKDFGIPEADLLATRRSPTTLAYVDHMLTSAHAGTIGEIAATLLPCSWGYAEIGQTLEARGKPVDHPLYCRWIEMYSSPEFGELAEWLRSFIDRIAMDLPDRQREASCQTSSSRTAGTSTSSGTPPTAWRHGPSRRQSLYPLRNSSRNRHETASEQASGLCSFSSVVTRASAPADR